jgi:hypothetical protein
MVQTLPEGLELRPLLIWNHDRGSLYHCLAIRTDGYILNNKQEATSSEDANNILSYILLNTGFGAKKTSEKHIHLISIKGGGDYEANFDPYRWTDETIREIHIELIKSWGKFIAKNKNVFIVENGKKSVITFKEYQDKVKAIEKSRR